MEGLSCLSRSCQLMLVALCEGNWCSGGEKGERPGGGRLQLFRPNADTCEHLATINLPPDLWFVDYSSLAIREDRIAVLSQQRSALWVGVLRPRSWEIADRGTCYYLPRDEEGHQQYSTAKGVSWLDDDHLVAGVRPRPEGPLPDEASEGTSLRAELDWLGPSTQISQDHSVQEGCGEQMVRLPVPPASSSSARRWLDPASV